MGKIGIESGFLINDKGRILIPYDIDSRLDTCPYNKQELRAQQVLTQDTARSFVSNYRASFCWDSCEEEKGKCLAYILAKKKGLVKE